MGKWARIAVVSLAAMLAGCDLGFPSADDFLPVLPDGGTLPDLSADSGASTDVDGGTALGLDGGDPGTIEGDDDDVVNGAPSVLDDYTPEPQASMGELGMEATIAAWRDRIAGHGDLAPVDTDSCREYLANIEVVVPDHTTFMRICTVCDQTDPNPDCTTRATGCAAFDNMQVNGEPHALIVVDSSSAEDPRTYNELVIHEMNHHLGYCSLDGLDYYHDSLARWAGPDHPDCPEEAVATSVSSMARDRLESWLGSDEGGEDGEGEGEIEGDSAFGDD